MSATSLPVSVRDKSLAAYLGEVRKYPILGAEEEYMLAQRWRAYGDAERVRAALGRLEGDRIDRLCDTVLRGEVDIAESGKRAARR